MDRSSSPKIVLIGHCGPDSSFLRMAIQSALKGATVLAADSEDELGAALDQQPELLLLNRVLDYGFAEAEGVQLIRRLRADHPNLKMMLVSNYADAQSAAQSAGALPGFGKRDIGSPRVATLLRTALSAATADDKLSRS